MNCPLCGASDLAAETDRYLRCPQCELLTQRTPPASLAIEESDARYGHDILSSDRRWLAMIAEAGPPVRSVLDLGAGNGGFVGFAQQEGWDAHGLEASPDLVRRGQQAGWPVQLADIDTWEAVAGRRFGVVRIWFVLEHIRQPGRLLQEAQHALLPGGLLAAAVPNDAGWLSRRVMHSESDRFWEHPLHLHHFPPFGLERWLEGRGFELVLAEAGRPTELMRGGTLPLSEAWERVRERDPELCRLFYKLGVGRNRELLLRLKA